MTLTNIKAVYSIPVMPDFSLQKADVLFFVLFLCISAISSCKSTGRVFDLDGFLSAYAEDILNNEMSYRVQERDREILIQKAVEGDSLERGVALRLLRSYKDSSLTRLFLESLGDNEDFIRNEALLAIEELGKESIPELIKMTQSETPGFRADAFAILANYPETLDDELLIAFSEDESSEISSIVPSVVNRVRDESSGVIDRLLTHEDTLPRIAGTKTLALYKTESAFEKILAMMDDPQFPVRSSAAFALVNFSEEHTSKILDIYNRSDGRKKIPLIGAMRSASDNEYTALLINELKNPNRIISESSWNILSSRSDSTIIGISNSLESIPSFYQIKWLNLLETMSSDIAYGLIGDHLGSPFPGVRRASENILLRRYPATLPILLSKINQGDSLSVESAISILRIKNFSGFFNKKKEVTLIQGMAQLVRYSSFEEIEAFLAAAQVPKKLSSDYRMIKENLGDYERIIAYRNTQIFFSKMEEIINLLAKAQQSKSRAFTSMEEYNLNSDETAIKNSEMHWKEASLLETEAKTFWNSQRWSQEWKNYYSLIKQFNFKRKRLSPDSKEVENKLTNSELLYKLEEEEKIILAYSPLLGMLN